MNMKINTPLIDDMYDSDEEHGIELPGPWRGGNRDYVYDQEDNFNYNSNSSNNGTNGNSEGSNGSGSGSGGGVSFVGDKNYESPNKVNFACVTMCGTFLQGE